MTLGEKIYSLRVKNGLSQEAFGEKLGVSRQSVSKWETDQSVPELDKIVMISELFTVTTDYLLKESAAEPASGQWKGTTAAGGPGQWNGASTAAGGSGQWNGVSTAAEGFGQWTKASGAEQASDVWGESSDTEQDAYECRGRAVVKRGFSYEYKSKRSWRGMPLVHVNIGFGRSAKGVIAIGLAAKGIVAIGLAGLGVITLAPVGIGLLLSAGIVAIGGIALGDFAIGVVAIGAFCVGIFSMGALAVGQFSFGAIAIGQQVAVGDVARGDIALGFSEATGTVFQQITGKQGGFDPQDVLRAIDEHVADYWFIFKQWIKGMIYIAAGI
ncbi:MAG: helix-turn-helix transcriptional regulator [Lachnospiraceae bacterium]|nr:helix-turn-helix transcriptional regulator [Lachnospiraceae bacterium]